MAQPTATDQKRELARQIEAARLQLGSSMHGFRHDLNVGSHARGAFQRNKTAWLSGAAVFGWIIAMLRPRKHKVLVDRHDRKKVQVIKRTGLILGMAKLLINLLKPTIMAYATKKIADLGSSSERAVITSNRAAKTSHQAAAVSKQASVIAKDAAG